MAPAGPPLAIVVAGFVAVLAASPLLLADGSGLHALGYLLGAVVPIALVGVARRVDVGRRRSSRYRPRRAFAVGLGLLALAASASAGLHVWPIATELAA